MVQPRRATLYRLATALALPSHRADELVRFGQPDAAHGGELLIRVLGPLDVVVDGASVEPGSATQRTLLGLLALSPNMPVDVAVLIEAVWGADPPSNAIDLLRTRMSRLRQRLERPSSHESATRLVIATPCGYQLTVADKQLDLLTFGALVERARLEVRRHRPASAFDLFRQATGLRRGSPMADLPGLRVDPAVVAVERDWQAVVIEFADTAATLGRDAEVIPFLQQVTDADPLHEPAHARLMSALAVSGRQAAALCVYDRLRHSLADELGVEPNAELSGLHQAILRGDLDSGAPAPPSAPARPAELPADTQGFAGRVGPLAQLDALLDAQADGAAVAIISGTAGVGKTSLAVHWAHWVRDQFPDGQLHVDMFGFDPGDAPLSPYDALHGFLEALAVPPERIPASLTARASLYRSVLAGKRVLVLLDNARDASQIRPLLPGTPGCLTLVTSRNQLDSLVATVGAHPVTLEPLTDGEARALLTHRIGPARVDAEPEAVDEILARCARLPLALAIVAARTLTCPQLPLAAIADELRSVDIALDPLVSADAGTDVRKAFSWSYRILTPPAARLFRLLGLHPGPDIGLPTVASLAGMPPDRLRHPLSELTAANLLTEHTVGRYRFHDLLRTYAAELTRAHDTAADRSAAQRRFLDHYLHTAHRAAMVLQPHRNPITLAPPAAGVTPGDIADHEQASDWFAAEHRAVLAAIRQAARSTGCDVHIWQLAWALGNYLDRRIEWDSQAANHQLALEAAGRLSDRNGQAHAHRGLGLAEVRRGRYQDAEAHLRTAIDLFGALGDHSGQGHTHLDLGYAAIRENRHQTALAHAREALDLFRISGHLAGEANALNGIGYCQAVFGDHEAALSSCGQALTLCQKTGDEHAEAPTWDTIGYIHHQRGQFGQAVAAYEKALELFQRLGSRYFQADVLNHLGDTHLADGDHAQAVTAWSRSLAILGDCGYAETETIRKKVDVFRSTATYDIGEPPGSSPG